jgi:hypothetical protein
MAILIYFHLPAKTCRCLPLHKPATKSLSVSGSRLQLDWLLSGYSQNVWTHRPMFPINCCPSAIFTGNWSGFYDVTILWASPALHIALVFWINTKISFRFSKIKKSSCIPTTVCCQDTIIAMIETILNPVNAVWNWITETTATLEPELTKHNNLDRLQRRK